MKVTKALVCIDHKWNMISGIYYDTQISMPCLILIIIRAVLVGWVVNLLFLPKFQISTYCKDQFPFFFVNNWVKMQ